MTGADLKALETKFTKAAIELYKTAKKECGQTHTLFIQRVSRDGGVAAAKYFIRLDEETSGFADLWMAGRLNLTIEALVIKPEYAPLFSEVERQICKDRLKEHGYPPEC